MNPDRMSQTIKLMLLLAFLLLWPAYAHAAFLGDLRMSLIQGDVQIKTADTDDWVPASINTPLMPGDIVWAPEGGRAGVQVLDGTVLRLDESTSLEILTAEKDSYQFHLTVGHAYVNFTGRRGAFLQMDTPVTSMRAFEPSVFRVDVSEDGFTEVSVFNGAVQIENRGGEATVSSGNTLSLGENDYAEFSMLGPADDWERWNKDRDRRMFEDRNSARYLPPEIQAYSYDFDENGRWQNIQGYGYVWRPAVVVSADWAPYRVGRWTWIGGDYVWVSYEPWGWAPYHYGRWAFVASIGWFWVPPLRGDVYWGPGFVGWVTTPTYVSWVPLAPGEVYYGHGYYGRHSVNITNVNITNINVTKVVYKNVNVRNSVTVIHHDTFVGGKHVDVHVTENPFRANRIHVGAPEIRPERTTRMPVVKEIPQRERPPEKIREIQVRELKEKRPMVKERDVSVINPHSPPKQLEVRPREVRPGEKPREPRPQEKTIEKPRGPERQIEKPKEVAPQEKRGIEKPRDVRPQEKVGPQPKAPGRQIEKPKEYRPPEKGVERSRPPQPAERALEKPKEVRPQEKVGERPQEVKPSEKAIERSKEIRPPERKPERPAEVRPPEKRAVEQPKEVIQERAAPKPQGGVERQRNGKPDRGGEGAKEKPGERERRGD